MQRTSRVKHVLFWVLAALLCATVLSVVVLKRSQQKVERPSEPHTTQTSPLAWEGQYSFAPQQGHLARIELPLGMHDISPQEEAHIRDLHEQGKDFDLYHEAGFFRLRMFLDDKLIYSRLMSFNALKAELIGIHLNPLSGLIIGYPYSPLVMCDGALLCELNLEVPANAQYVLDFSVVGPLAGVDVSAEGIVGAYDEHTAHDEARLFMAAVPASEAAQELNDATHIPTTGSLVPAIRSVYYDAPSLLVRLSEALPKLVLCVVGMLFLLIPSTQMAKLGAWLARLYTLGDGLALAVVEVVLAVCFVLMGPVNYGAELSLVAFFAGASLVAAIKPRAQLVTAREVLASPARLLVFVLVDLFCAFEFVGMPSFVYPLTHVTSLCDLAIFALCALWCAPLLLSLLRFVLSPKAASLLRAPQHPSMHPLAFGMLASLCLMLVPVLCALAFNPAISTYDTAFALRLAHNPLGATQDQPFFYILVLHLLLKLVDHPASIVVAQLLLWWYVHMRIFFFMRTQQVRDGLILAAALLISLNMGNSLLLVTAWKDIPYGCSLLLLASFVVAYVLDTDAIHKKIWPYIDLVLGIIGTTFFRFNGPAAVILVVLALVLVGWHDMRLRMGLAAALAFSLIISGPVFDHYQLKERPDTRILSALVLDMAGVHAAGGSISEEGLAVVTWYNFEDVAPELYRPTYARYPHTPHRAPSNAELARVVVQTFVRNPGLYLRAFLARQDLSLDFWWGEETFVYNTRFMTAHSLPIEIDNMPDRIDTPLNPVMSQALAQSKNVGLWRALMWRRGLSSLLALLSLAALARLRHPREALVLAAAWVGQLGGLWLTSGYGAEFRFYWPDGLLSCLLFSCVVALMCRNTRSSLTELEQHDTISKHD